MVGRDRRARRNELRNLCSYEFVNRANDYARHDHFDKAADAYQHEELCGKGLRRVNRAARADPQNFQHDSQANTGRNSAPANPLA
jgi:hypothetical protein